MTEILAGLAAAIGIIGIYRITARWFSAKLFAATVLVGIAFIYVGFSLKQNPPELIVLEVAMALGFYFMALIGYVRKPSLIAIGIILHGVWDFFHHSALLIPTDIPDYWPAFCSIIDVIDGVYFWVLFRRQKPDSLAGIG